MLAGEGIKKSYNGKEVLHGIDLGLEPGKITALIGPSGAGKTTLLRVLSLLDPPDSGKVFVDDAIYPFPQGKRKRNRQPAPWPKVTVVFQQLFLWPHLTLRQNINLPLNNKKDDNTKNYVDELIRSFEMTDFLDQYPNQASLGQRQRAALVRALALRPKYLLLDEITSALDVEQVKIVLYHLQDLRDQGVGILVATHLLGFAHEIADRVVFLNEGVVLETGGTEVLDKPANERLQQFLSTHESDIADIDRTSQLRFVGDAVSTRIKGGDFPSDHDAEFLNRSPLIEIIRLRINSKDIPRLLNIIDRHSGPSAVFALNLLRNYGQHEGVKKRLRSRWDDASVFLRCHLMWRILDDPDLPMDWHAKLFEFVIENWDVFKKNVLNMFGGVRRDMVREISQRIHDIGFAEYKKWAYLCCVPEVFDDQDAAEKLVRSALSSSDPFTREVANRLLTHFFSAESV
jgi:polar amino acid transport system ATP-binding protein